MDTVGANASEPSKSPLDVVSVSVPFAPLA